MGADRADDLPGDESGSIREGMPSTLGTADSSYLDTLAQSIGRVPQVRLHDTGVGEGGRAGE